MELLRPLLFVSLAGGLMPSFALAQSTSAQSCLNAAGADGKNHDLYAETNRRSQGPVKARGFEKAVNTGINVETRITGDSREETTRQVRDILQHLKRKKSNAGDFYDFSDEHQIISDFKSHQVGGLEFSYADALISDVLEKASLPHDLPLSERNVYERSISRLMIEGDQKLIFCRSGAALWTRDHMIDYVYAQLFTVPTAVAADSAYSLLQTNLKASRAAADSTSAQSIPIPVPASK